MLFPAVVRSAHVDRYSYYDPNTEATLRAFRSSLEWAASRDGGISDRDLDEAKLAIFGSVDAPETPASVGVGDWVGGVSDERRQRRRAQLLQCGADEVRDVARWLLAQEDDAHSAVHTTIVGSDSTSTFRDADGWTHENLSNLVDTQHEGGGEDL